MAWTSVSIVLSQPWLHDLIKVLGTFTALFIVTFVAYVPGYMNAFLIGSILLDRRPARTMPDHYPGISVLVACYNESVNVATTIRSLARQDYPGDIQILILDDGSTDDTVAAARQAIASLSPYRYVKFQLITGYPNVGKSGALNRGLAMADHGLVVTVDGDSLLHFNALRRIVERYLSDPPDTKAVAGSIAVRNSRTNLLTKMQEWDYFHGIAAVKRMQSMYHGTLVAQGAFSLYEKEMLEDIGGWPDCVGEDIVISWAILRAGHRIGYCEDAVLFTVVPSTLSTFAKQRQRWSRGLVEAFVHHWPLLTKPRMSMQFIWWNFLFPFMDIAYTFAFIPGVILALFGHYQIAGIMTLTLLPLAMLWNVVIFRIQRRMFHLQDLRVRRNFVGFFLFVLGYSFILQPVCIWGYAKEMLGLRKTWGTK